MTALIVYWTKTGHTERAAEDIAKGLRAAGVEVVFANLRKASVPEVAPHNFVIVGSPCHAGSVPGMGSGIAVKVEQFVRSLPPEALVNKRAAAFAVNSGYGGARTVMSLENLLAKAGAEVQSPGIVVKAGVPLSLWRGPLASAEDRARLREFGRQLAGIAVAADR
ncbi:MAG: flavodoxin family protein [Candidatus Zipacnadales bacterium]